MADSRSRLGAIEVDVLRSGEQIDSVQPKTRLDTDQKQLQRHQDEQHELLRHRLHDPDQVRAGGADEVPGC